MNVLLAPNTKSSRVRTAAKTPQLAETGSSSVFKVAGSLEFPRCFYVVLTSDTTFDTSRHQAMKSSVHMACRFEDSVA